MTSAKTMIFVSTGRCGTKRIYEILRDSYPDIIVQHQTRISRIINVLGNLIYLFGGRPKALKKTLYRWIAPKEVRDFITSDPLSAMIVPKEQVLNPNTMIIHILRSKQSFAHSFFKISRKRLKSLIAHNLIPFWQLGVWPLENLMSKKIKQKYEAVHDIKTKFFQAEYSINPNYRQISMQEVFETDFLEQAVNQFFGKQIHITEQERFIKSNLS